MKRLLLLSMCLVCLVTGYGQGSKTKQVTRLPANSAAIQASAKGRDAQVIDGSQNVQTRAGGQSANPYATTGGQQRLLPKRINRDSIAAVEKMLNEPQSVFIERERSQLRSSTVRSHQETAFAFFKETPQLKIPHPELQIRIDTVETDYLNMTHVKGTQLFCSIPVYGMNFTFHISEQSERFLGYTVDTTYMNTTEVRFSAADAVRIARQDLIQTTTINTPGEFMKQTLNYEHPTVEEIYYPTKLNTYNYSYKVIIRPNIRDEWIYYIDAHSGEVVEKYNNTPSEGPNTGTGKDLHDTSRTVNTYLWGNGTHYMANATKPMFKAEGFTGIIGVYDAKNNKEFREGTATASLASNASTTWNNPAAISTMYYSTQVYDYLQNTFKRNSFDGKGASMVAVINVPHEDGGGYDNAYWNGAFIALGNGRNAFYPLAGALDVVAHEWGHAVVSHTAKLEYKNQSGAINETFADIFGAMVDRANWTIGETIIKDTRYYPSGAMRNMANPHNGGTKEGDRGWQPANISEVVYLGTDYDYGGVHYNSGISNYAFYLYATATSKERAEQVYYRALATYLTPTSKFIDLRKAVIQAARDLNFSGDVQTLSNTFDKVGIIDEPVDNQPPPQPPTDLPTNPGQWGMLICNADPADGNSLYKTTDYRSITPISTTVMYSTPSVTDDGKYTIFVDDKNNIRRLDMTTGREETINSEGDNQSVAISRDGKRMAVITTYEDGLIYVYDFNTGKWVTFKLYNPTTSSDGARSGGPRYADAIEFDHTGEYLLYDAYNVVGSSVGGSMVEYWDIGLLHVWDNSKNTWGTGEIVKLFSDLTGGVQVFNPVFAKNSPYIIAFDFYDEEDDTNAIVGANLTTTDVDVIHLNVITSSPSYSMDDKRIAFNSFDFKTNDYAVAYKDLGSDKISPKVSYTDETIFVTGGLYPVYYGTGTRQLGTKPVASFTSDARQGIRSLNVQFVDMSDGNPTSWRWTFQGGMPPISSLQHPKVAYLTVGTYPVRLVATNSYGSDEVVRQGYITVGATSAEFIVRETVAVYPNPASDDVWVSGATDKVQHVQLFDLTGKTIPVTFASEEGKIRFDVSGLPRGTYILQVVLSEGNMQTHKLIKN